MSRRESSERRRSFLRPSLRSSNRKRSEATQVLYAMQPPTCIFFPAKTADPNARILVPRFKVRTLAVSPLSCERERCLFLNLSGALFVPRFGRVISRFVMIAGDRPAFIAAALAACGCCLRFFLRVFSERFPIGMIVSHS